MDKCDEAVFPKIVPNLPEQTEKHLGTIFYKKIWKLFWENVNYLFKCLNNILEFTMKINPSAEHSIYRVTHKGWDFRDECTEFIYYLFLYIHDFLWVMESVYALQIQYIRLNSRNKGYDRRNTTWVKYNWNDKVNSVPWMV